MNAIRLKPGEAYFPTTNPARRLKTIGTNWVYETLYYDQTTEQSAHWLVEIPGGVSFTGASIDIYSVQAAAVVGTIGWKVTTITRADGEVLDTAGTTDTVTADTVEDAAGEEHKQTAALTVTGWAAGEVLLVKIARDVANDTVTEDAQLVVAVIRLT